MGVVVFNQEVSLEMNKTNTESAPTESSLPGEYTCTVLGESVDGVDLPVLHRGARAIVEKRGNRHDSPYRINVFRAGHEFTMISIEFGLSKRRHRPEMCFSTR